MTVYKSIGLNIDWTIGPLDYFLDHFLDPFLGLFFFWTILSRGGGGRPQVLREGWAADCCYWGRGAGRTSRTQVVLGVCCVSKCCRLMEFSLDYTNYCVRFFDWLFLCQIFAQGLSASLSFCQANAKLAPKHWTIIVIENSHQFLFLILYCWVMRVSFESICANAKCYSQVITNHPSIASRFPLCKQ